jgi:pimeloyl-ACP methyl ester carboxylesterase
MAGGEKYSAEPVIEKSMGNFWYWFGLATEKIAQKRVTFPMRRERADLYRQAKEARKTELGSDERQDSAKDYETQTRIEREFVDQQDLEVETPWGTQKAKYVILNKGAEGKRPPIIVIPGASNGTESMDSFLRELARQMPDRQVILIGYPDAPSGEVTPEFCAAVEEVDGFEPHTAFFEAAINKLYPERKFDLLGYSAGGGIVENYLTGSNRVLNAVLMSPGGSKNISEKDFGQGVVYENLSLLRFLKDLPRNVFVDDKTRDEQKRLKFSTWIKLGKRVCKDNLGKMLGKMKVEGKIGVISGEKDMLTKSAEIFNPQNLENLRKRQDNLDVSVIANSLHAGPLLEPGKYVAEIKRLMGWP